MKMYRRLGLLAALVMMTSAAFAQMTLVSKGKAKAYIVLAEDNSVNREAADMLARFVNKISGAQLEIAPTKAKGGAIVIGEAAATPAEDGFELVCKNGALHIKTGGGKGAVYGVVTLLERYMGVSYYAYKAYTLTPSANIELPEIEMSDKPTATAVKTPTLSAGSVWRTVRTSLQAICGYIPSTAFSPRRSMARSTPNTIRSSTASAALEATASGVSPILRSTSWRCRR